MCVVAARYAAAYKRTLLSLARRSDHPRRSPLRCWSGRQTAVPAGVGERVLLSGRTATGRVESFAVGAASASTMPC